MSTTYDTLVYRSSVYQRNESTDRSRACVDVIPIRVNRWKSFSKYNPEIHGYDYQDPVFVSGGTLKLRFSRERVSEDAKTTMERLARYKRVIDRSPLEANKLRDKLRRYVYNHVGVSEVGHPFVIEEILSVLQQAVPDKIIEVQTIDFTFRDTEERRLELLDYLYYRSKLIPASESFIKALEKASPVDDDELECAICMEMFAQKEDTCSITKLPCAHYYHRDCIAPWLRINHVCPTCRRPNAPSS